MAIRRRELHPDDVFTTRAGEQIAVVSEEQFLNELVSLGRWQLFAGGVIQSLVLRAPTGLEGEMVTVGGVLEWKDRTDARAQPEPDAMRSVLAQTGSLQMDAGGDLAESIRNLEPDEGPDILGTREVFESDEPEERKREEPAPPATDDDLDDGLDVDPNAVDESEIPEHLRG